MSKVNSMIESLKTMPYSQKKNLLQYLVRMVESGKNRFSREEQEALLQYAYEEVDKMRVDIPRAESYKEKDYIFECENYVLGIVMHLAGTPDKLPPETLQKVQALAELVDKERYVETTLDSIFEEPTIGKTEMNRLLFWVRQTADEYQKSKLYMGLAYYAKDLKKLNGDAKKMLTDYIASELSRLMTLDTEDTWNALELLADVSKHFADEKVIALLQELVKLGRSHINFYAVETLLGLGQSVPQAAIDALAADLEYANLTYGSLQRHGKTAMFPAEYATEEYLAKSDLVRWLTYPTELGKAPDEIAYIGRVKKFLRKEVFHVFKYRSDSDNLDDEKKNKWLIGWSSNEGGTFSNFDEYAPFEQETVEKTLKLIQKKLIG